MAKGGITVSIHSIEGNLQFALLAVQLQFVDRQQCVGLLHEWLRDTTGSLPSLMRDHGVLTDERAGYIEEMLSAPQPRGDETASRARGMTWLGPVSEQPAGDDDHPVTDDGRPAGRLLRAVRQPAEVPAEDAAEGPVLGRFRIVRFHQEGGLGRVSIARDLELDRDVALKEMKDQIADDPLRRDRFVLEAEITGGLEHPSIVPVYGLGYQDDGRPYYAMRLVRGDTLERAIHTFHETDWSQLPPGEKAVQQRRLLGRFLDACHAVHYAHERGVLHRDIKPGNIMLGEYGETLVVDWGLAKAEGDWIRPEHLPQQDESRLLSPRTNTAIEATLMGQTIGTPHYMSPEQAAGDWNQLGPAADIYSLGATLFTVLTNRPPLEGQSVDELLAKARRHEISTPRSIKRDVPRPLEAICLQAMAPYPQDRYRSVRELSDDVERFLADHTVSAYREPVAERMARLARRHRGIVRLAVASLVVFAIGATVAAWQIHRQKLAADDARDVAQASQIRAERVLSYLVRAFRRPDPQLDGRLITVAEVLQQTTHELKRSLADQPRDRAQLLDAIGTSYIGLGLYNDATDVLADAHRLEQDLLGGQHLDTLTTGSRLAEALRGSGRLEEATQLCQQVLQRAGAFLPPNHPLVLATMGRRGMPAGRGSSGSGHPLAAGGTR